MLAFEPLWAIARQDDTCICQSSEVQFVELHNPLRSSHGYVQVPGFPWI